LDTLSCSVGDRKRKRVSPGNKRHFPHVQSSFKREITGVIGREIFTQSKLPNTERREIIYLRLVVSARFLLFIPHHIRGMRPTDETVLADIADEPAIQRILQTILEDYAKDHLEFQGHLLTYLNDTDFNDQVLAHANASFRRLSIHRRVSAVYTTYKATVVTLENDIEQEFGFASRSGSMVPVPDQALVQVQVPVSGHFC